MEDPRPPDSVFSPKFGNSTPKSDRNRSKRSPSGFRASPATVTGTGSDTKKSPTSKQPESESGVDTSDDLDIVNPLIVPRVLQERLATRPFAELNDSDDLVVSPKGKINKAADATESTKTQGSPISALTTSNVHPCELSENVRSALEDYSYSSENEVGELNEMIHIIEKTEGNNALVRGDDEESSDMGNEGADRSVQRMKVLFPDLNLDCGID
jgi:hypothetical protein